VVGQQPSAEAADEQPGGRGRRAGGDVAAGGGVQVQGGGIGSGLALIDCSDFTGDDLLAHDIWYRLGRPGGSFGFGVLSNPRLDPTYPRAIVFQRCRVRTVLATSRMEYGFRNDVPARLTAGKPNRAEECIAEGWRRQAFYGFA
jgi:hypothetical protein